MDVIEVDERLASVVQQPRPEDRVAVGEIDKLEVRPNTDRERPAHGLQPPDRQRNLEGADASVGISKGHRRLEGPVDQRRPKPEAEVCAVLFHFEASEGLALAFPNFAHRPESPLEWQAALGPKRIHEVDVNVLRALRAQLLKLERSRLGPCRRPASGEAHKRGLHMRGVDHVLCVSTDFAFDLEAVVWPDHEAQLGGFFDGTVGSKAQHQRLREAEALDAPSFVAAHVLRATGDDHLEVRGARDHHLSMHNVVGEELQDVTVDEGSEDHGAIGASLAPAQQRVARLPPREGLAVECCNGLALAERESRLCLLHHVHVTLLRI
mmetsp:Transcript_82570/g.230230  ORF Transcript_82570/g.230230 Transcript_82570/m.230230 type:complete len:323 (-) Transcript_82570:347-1315(-)